MGFSVKLDYNVFWFGPQVFSVLEDRLLDILGIRISECFCFRWKPVPRWGMVSFVTSLGNGYIGFLALWLVISCLRTPSLTFVSGFCLFASIFLAREWHSFCDGRFFLIEQLQVRVKEPASGQGASSSGLSSVTFIYCLNPFPAGLMGWTREGDIARNFFLLFSKGQLSEREEIPFLTGIWFSSPLFSLFLNPLVFLDSGFVFLPGGFFPGGVLFSLPELPPILGGILSDSGGSGFKEP